MVAYRKVAFCKTRLHYIHISNFKTLKVKEKVIKIIAGEKLIFYYITDITNYFPGIKRGLRAQSKEQSQDNSKKLRKLR